MERWTGKVAVVTGASSGIGEAICKTLVDDGLIVMGLARREDRLQQLLNSLSNGKGSFFYRRCDVRNEKDIVDAFAEVANKFGGVDVLVNNAGIAITNTIADASTEDFRAILEVNILGPTICTREAIKLMRIRKNEGHIININSIFGLNATVIKSPVNLYPASKFALRAMTETTKLEIVQNKDNIRTTSIHPGVVHTEMPAAVGITDDIIAAMPHLQSQDIADCVKFALQMPLNVQLDEIAITPLHQSF